jgi:hypothetical protein
MNSNPEDFDALRKLLALKRHEIPPPGYMRELPGKIRNRIERGEGQLNLWDRISGMINMRPSLAYAFGLMMCGTLGLSTVYMVRQEMTQTADSSQGLVLRRPAPVTAMANDMDSSAPTIHVANWLRNTNPIAETQPQMSLFGNTDRVVRIVSYQPGN